MKRARYGAALGITLGFGLVASCGGAPEKSGSIGANGGVVSLADGSGVRVGAGAVSSAIDVTVTIDDGAPAPAAAVEVGHAYRFGPEGQQFASPVQVTLAIDATRIPAGRTIADVVVYTAAVGSASYAALATTVADAQHVQAETSHFSIFVPVIATGALMDMSAGPDMSAVADMAGDLAGAIDLGTAAVDAATADLGPCYYTGTGGGGTCTLTADCDGHAYHLACVNAQCTCSTDGTATSAMFQHLQGCPTAWPTCGYPGTAAP